MANLRSYIKNTADPVFSRYIRLKEADHNGYAKCVTCGVVLPITELDAGHYVNREDWPTRFDERNVHCQCTTCNRFHAGRISRYAVYLKERYGDGILDELDAKSRKVKTFTLSDLKEWVKEWRVEIEKLSTLKGYYFSRAI
jgi:hypothetical protein